MFIYKCPFVVVYEILCACMCVYVACLNNGIPTLFLFYMYLIKKQAKLDVSSGIISLGF